MPFGTLRIAKTLCFMRKREKEMFANKEIESQPHKAKSANAQKPFEDENSTKSQNYPPKMINLAPKFIIYPVNYKFPQKC